MNEQKADARESLQGLSQGDATKLGFLQDIIAHSYTESGLDPQTFILVHMAAQATLDAAPASWLMNIAVSGEAGLEPEQILGTLTAIAPVIGTARIVSASRWLSIVDAPSVVVSMNTGSCNGTTLPKKQFMRASNLSDLYPGHPRPEAICNDVPIG